MLFPFPQVNKVSHSMYPLFNPKRQEYKCIFYGETAYDTLAQLSLFDQKKAWGSSMILWLNYLMTILGNKIFLTFIKEICIKI